MAENRAETLAKKRDESRQKLETELDRFRKIREEAAAAGAEVYVGDWNSQQGAFALHDVETGRRVGLVTGADQTKAAARMKCIIEERATLNVQAEEAEKANTSAIKKTNDAARKAALDAINKKPAAKPVAEELVKGA